jgi:putative flippase GtrA
VPPDRTPPWRTPLFGELQRYLLVGGVNTALTTAAFYALSLLVAPAIAFSLVYFGALAILTVITPRFVFRVRLQTRHSAAVAAWYLFTYVIGLGVIRLLEGASLERWAITLGTVMVTSPLSFFGTRLISRRPSRQATGTELRASG